MGLASPAHVMGILNVTPDSFSDGGDYLTVDQAVARASEMIEEGAAIIDVGGASSRPKGKTYGEGAPLVPPEEEAERVVPVISALSAQHPNVWISIDTFSSTVAAQSVAAGAHMINDITGLRAEPELADLAASESIPIVVMHSLGRPGMMPHGGDYRDVVDEVKRSLAESIAVAESRGVDQIIVDPGFGFGKSVQDNLRLIASLDVLLELQRPVMVGISRKSTVGAILGSPEATIQTSERLYGSLGATAVAILRGASIIRTHDVQPTTQMLKLMSATLSA